MARDLADDSALRAALADTQAERDRLRAALDDADARIAGLRREAQAASRAKADFMARMTHEMRTPLSAIIGLANLSLAGETLPKKADSLVKIRTSAKALLDVIDDITDFSRLEKGLADVTPVSCDLEEVLGRVEARFAEAARSKGLTLRTLPDARAPRRLLADSARLEQILGHLVGNAVKFTEYGEVAVSVGLVGRSDKAVRLEFSVRDTGIGMDPATVPDMLESFTQADGSLSRPYGGTGLGLAIVGRGVALLGGDLRTESAPGRGTRFSFCLDLAEDAPGEDDAAPETAPPPAGAAAPPLAGAAILLVEDNAINQQVARETLERFGATVAVARHGGEAVAMVQSAAYDAVLMDVQMPVMDGLLATRRIRALPGMAALPIVALTAHALAEDRDHCLAAGMNDYLTKPIDAKRLLTTLGRWILPARDAADAAAGGADTPPRADRPRPGQDPGLHLATALGRLGGNERLLRSVAAEFCRDYAACADTLAKTVAAGDLDAARRLAHTVKGVAGNIAADGLAAAARDLENLLAAGQTPATGAMDAFAAALTRTLDAAAALAPPAEPQPARAADDVWNVLLVDDAKLNRAIIAQILTSAGHDVICAANGKEACRLLFGGNTLDAPPDLILMDIEMPEMNGIEAARLIRKLLAASLNPPCAPDVPIVALTFHEAARERPRCLDAGMTDCLDKVFDHAELLSALGRIMAGRPIPARGDRDRPTASAEALAAVLRDLAVHLDQGNIRADEDLAALRKLVVVADGPEATELADLGAAIERYDFAAALDSLVRLAPLLGLDPEAVARTRPSGPEAS